MLQQHSSQAAAQAKCIYKTSARNIHELQLTYMLTAAPNGMH